MQFLSTVTVIAHVVLDTIFPPRDSQLLVRTADHTDLLPRIRSLSSHHWTAILSYTDPLVRAAVVETKFHDNVKAARMLGHTLRSYLQDSPHYINAVVIPIPLSPTRQHDRGYNQVERVCTYAGVPTASSLLQRVRDTPPQTTLSARERKENIHNAFICPVALEPSHTYFVLDDVVTTGATLEAAVSALREAGAVQVHAVALAHQPRNGTV